jgi:hypothetical protein
MNDYRFEVSAKITVFADSQAAAIKVVEERLTPGLLSRDPHALVVTEVNSKRVAAKR